MRIQTVPALGEVDYQAPACPHTPAEVLQHVLEGRGNTSNWRLSLESLTRAGVAFPTGGVRVTLMLTISDVDAAAAIREEMRLNLQNKGIGTRGYHRCPSNSGPGVLSDVVHTGGIGGPTKNPGPRIHGRRRMVASRRPCAIALYGSGHVFAVNDDEAATAATRVRGT